LQKEKNDFQKGFLKLMLKDKLQSEISPLENKKRFNEIAN
jgi:hypothetical protein